MIIRAKIIFDLSPPPMIKCEKSPFYLPCKKLFFGQAANTYFFMLPPEELQSHAKNDMSDYRCLQICSKNLHNWHFFEIVVQISKNNSSQSCIKCIFVA